MKVGQGEELWMGGRIEVAMDAVDEDALDEGLEVRVGDESAPNPVVGRGESADASREEDAAGPQNAKGLGKGRCSVGRFHQMVERAEQQDRIHTCVSGG
ncbi:MAG: hypothetical protein ACR2J5_12345 [Geodermatophilaceae bacterium]